MASEEKTFLLKSEGGLDAVSSDIELFERPGFAVALENVEPALLSGYEQVSGFTKFGTAAPGGVVAAKVTSTKAYFDGSIVTKGGSVYFSSDGITWVQVNRDTLGGFDTAAVLAGRADLPRTTTNSEQYRYATYHNGTELELILVDTIGTNPLSRLVIRDNAGTTEYKYQDTIAADWPAATLLFPTFVEVHNDRVVAGGFPTDKTLIHYSDLYKPIDFLNGGSLDNADELVWAKGFRKNLILFGRNSISQVISLGNATQQVVQDVTRNIGCLAGESVQEVGGDLVFLAPDGIRTIAGTSRIDDTELGTLSRLVNPILNSIILNLGVFTVSSTVIRNRNNYRLFFFQPGVAAAKQIGIGGVLKGGEGGLRWEWCQYKGLPVYDVDTFYDTSGVEVSYHVSQDDIVYQHNTSDLFDGVDIISVYQTPEIHLGDPFIRKGLHKIRVYTTSANDYSYSVKLTFDNGSPVMAPSPAVYLATSPGTSATYGTSVYGTGIYGRARTSFVDLDVSGSGATLNIKIVATGSKRFSIQGLAVTYFVDGRQ
jgi:hypothetical protein